MRSVGKIILIAFAVYVFFLLVTSIDFKGMTFAEIKLVLSICAGVAMSFVVGAKTGANFIYSALAGFVSGVFFLLLIQMIFK